MALHSHNIAPVIEPNTQYCFARAASLNDALSDLPNTSHRSPITSFATPPRFVHWWFITLGLLLPLSTAVAQPQQAAPAKAPASTLVCRDFLPQEPLNRARRPTPLVAVVENTGSADVTFKPKLFCPAGVRELRPRAGRETTVKPGARVIWSCEIQADRAMQGDLVLELWSGDKIAAKATLPMSFLPLAKIKKAAYIPPPQPVKTTILVGAHNCPLWEAAAPQMWEQVVQHPERTPALGFYDQANPQVADWETKWAVEHGVNFFVYCWYRVGRTDAVETKYSSAIEALLKSRFANQFKFTIMWENQQRGPAWGSSGVSSERELLETLAPFWITNYFLQPSYLKVDNKPLLFVYDAHRLAADLGGATNVPRAFEQFRAACRRAGFAGLHILAEYRGLDPNELEFRKDMGFDYTFAYVWPIADPQQAIPKQPDFIRKTRDLNILPEVVTVSQGWTGWRNEGPLYRIPPGDYENLLRQAKDILTTMPQQELGGKLLLLDNWNEWSEGHYVAPHRQYGFGYLDAVRKVFSDAPDEHVDIIPEDIGFGPYDSAYKARPKK